MYELIIIDRQWLLTLLLATVQIDLVVVVPVRHAVGKATDSFPFGRLSASGFG